MTRLEFDTDVPCPGQEVDTVAMVCLGGDAARHDAVDGPGQRGTDLGRNGDESDVVALPLHLHHPGYPGAPLTQCRLDTERTRRELPSVTPPYPPQTTQPGTEEGGAEDGNKSKEAKVVQSKINLVDLAGSEKVFPHPPSPHLY